MTNNFSKMSPVVKLNTDIDSIASMRNINTIEYNDISSNFTYIILNCNESILCYDEHIQRLYNSVILDIETRSILCIGPPIAYEMHNYQKLYPEKEQSNDSLIIEEMIEGVSIQMFYEFRSKKWELSTKNAVSGNYAYYRLPNYPSKTYREMFCDVIGVENNDINSWKGIQYMNEKNCYHFILKHPENHIVFNNVIPKLYFIGMYKLHIGGARNDILYVNSHQEEVFPSSIVSIPETFTCKIPFKYEDIIQSYLSIHEDKFIMGISFLQKTNGDRSFVIHSKYEQLRLLRGTHPNLMYQYICLRRINRVKEFLRYFPQYKAMFWTFHIMFNNLLEHMHKCYYDYYVKKLTLKTAKSLFYHISQIHHTIYKPSLLESKTVVITKQVVYEYLQSLEPGCLFHLLQNEKYIAENVV